MADRKLSEGASKLRRALRPNMSQAGLADTLEVTQQAVSAWVHGSSKPSVDKMAKLEEMFGIPMRAWTEDAEDCEESDSAPTGTDR